MTGMPANNTIIAPDLATSMLRSNSGDFRENIERPGVIGFLLLCLAAVLLPLWAITPSWIALISVSFLLVSWRWGDRIAPWLKVVVVLCATAAVIAEHHALLTREAGLSLIVLMSSLKVLELKRLRDGFLMVGLCWFLLFCGFLVHQSLLYDVYLLLCMPLPLLALMRLNRRHNDRFGWALLRALLRWVALAIPLMLVLYFFFPRLSIPLWSVPGMGNGSGSTGMSDEMTVGDVADLALNDDPAFQAYFDRDMPLASQRYWRSSVLDEFDGLTWRRASFNERAEILEKPDKSISYRIALLPSHGHWLPVLDWPLADVGNASVVRGRVMKSFYDIVRPIEYRARASLSPVYAANIDAAHRNLNLQLPVRINPHSRELAMSLSLRYPHSPDLVRALLRQIHSESFFYTLHPPVLEENIVDDFWFNKRRGYCEHYANAMAFILRAAGIPARIVVGYQGGEWQTFGHYLQVRQSDAHAWVEYWQDGVGWTRADPTAAIAPQRVDVELRDHVRSKDGLWDVAAWSAMAIDQNLIARLHSFWQDSNRWFDSHVIHFNEDSQRDWFSQFGLEHVDLAFLVRGLVIGFLLALMLISNGLLRRRTVKDPVARTWQQFVRVMAKKGIVAETGEPPLAFGLRCSNALGAHTETINGFVHCYLRARFSRDGAAQRELPQYLKRLLKKI